MVPSRFAGRGAFFARGGSELTVGRRASGSLPSRKPAVRRLIMIATSSWSWPLTDASCDAHENLLRDLLSSTPDGYRAACFVPAESDPGPKWFEQGEADLVVDEVVQRLRTIGRGYRGADGDGDLGRRLEEVRHRVFLDPAQFHHVLGVPPARRPTVPHFVVLDFRFVYYLGEPTCHVSVAAFSDLPLGTMHRPDAAIRLLPAPTVHPLAEYHRVFVAAQRLAEARIADAFTRSDFRVLGRQYNLPTIWVAVPARPDRDPRGYTEAQPDLVNGLAALTLDVGDARDCVVSRTVVNGHLLTLRRFKPINRDHNVPCYLLIPGQLGSGGRDVSQERMTAEVVETLTELEARAGASLFDVQNDMEIWCNHLELYAALAERGRFLWDGLSTHLPMRRWWRLSRVHRSVELLHQILLQGIADLAHLSTLTRASLARVHAATEQLLDEYDSRLTEHHEWQSDGLRRSLSRSGVVSRVQDGCEAAVAQADRVKAEYDDLLDTIAKAFDERRVRESDVLQKSSAILSFGLGLGGIVTVFDAVVQMKPNQLDAGTILFHGHDGWLSPLAASTTLGLGVVFTVVSLAVVFGTALSGRLGSHWFRRRYDGSFAGRRRTVWRFLKDASTDMLEAFGKATAKLDPDAAARAWRAHDEDLARRFADLWDWATLTGADAGTAGRLRADTIDADIRLLSRRIEQWGIHGLLVTERPRIMYRYRLPKLTMLYRACTFLPGTFLTDMTENVVAENDFARSLRNLGFTWEQALLVDRYLLGRIRRDAPEVTAGSVLSLLDELGLHAALEPAQVDRIARRLARLYPGT